MSVAVDTVCMRPVAVGTFASGRGNKPMNQSIAAIVEQYDNSRKPMLAN